LTVNYDARGGQPFPALRHVDLDISPGEILGILGESGCGKSTLALSLLGLLPGNAHVEGSIFFEDEDLSKASESRWSAIRGAKVAGLKGNKIPVGSRIVAVIDSYDAMISNRCYRKGLPHAEAVRRLLADSGAQFDPVVVRAFVEIAEHEVEEVFGATGISSSAVI